jgi:hypothetical protein
MKGRGAAFGGAGQVSAARDDSVDPLSEESEESGSNGGVAVRKGKTRGSGALNRPICRSAMARIPAKLVKIDDRGNQDGVIGIVRGRSLVGTSIGAVRATRLKTFELGVRNAFTLPVSWPCASKARLVRERERRIDCTEQYIESQKNRDLMSHAAVRTVSRAFTAISAKRRSLKAKSDPDWASTGLIPEMSSSVKSKGPTRLKSGFMTLNDMNVV